MGALPRKVRPLPFIWTHYLKLLSMCIVGYAAYLLLNALYESYPPTLIYGILSQLSMLSNLNIFSHNTYAPGPYWYFGLMLQLLCCLSSAPFPSLVGRDRRSDPRM